LDQASRLRLLVRLNRLGICSVLIYHRCLARQLILTSRTTEQARREPRETNFARRGPITNGGSRPDNLGEEGTAGPVARKFSPRIEARRAE